MSDKNWIKYGLIPAAWAFGLSLGLGLCAFFIFDTGVAIGELKCRTELRKEDRP
ncbi:hypothetical protein [Azotobacter vinelandii]|uniref:hypothetical protein n=1 Tax=Azotobacter vinelandii TaxID=354 RepID=UPI00092427ED|nr:hypothetical protein [Azotobacter vinelandii]SFY30367.1 hypothetical protein SAMN04244547_04988 [Azotobacter vinelandii]